MANISQIEINSTVFNLEDAEIRDKINQFTDYYNSNDSYMNPFTSLNHDHAHAVVSNGVSLYAMNGENNIGRSLNLWGDTGNFRVDKLDFSTDTTTTLGYIPLSKYTTKNSYAYTTDKSLFTPASNYAVNYLRMRRWGQIVEFQIRLTHSNSISIPAAGRFSTAITLGTLNDANWCPASTTYLHSFGDNVGPLWGYITTAGVVKWTAAEAFGTAARTIAPHTSSQSSYIDLNGVYVTPMTNNY